MPILRLGFPGALGHRLSAELELPADREPVAYALFAHCFTCNKNFKAVHHISNALVRRGYAVLRFDFTGLGQSEGRFAHTTFSSNVGDLLAAAEYLAREYQGPRLLIGHSLGGAAVLHAARRIEGAVAVATLAAPSEPSHVLHLLRDDLTTLRERGEAVVEIAGRSFCVGKAFLDDLDQQRMQETVGDLRQALLVMHAPLDRVVSIDNASQIFLAARHPKSFVSLDTADHLLSKEEDAAYAGEMIAAWAHRYLPASRARRREQELSDNRVAAHTGHSGFKTDIVANGHSLVADEPERLGGTNRGPSPYDLMGAALAACTSMTLRMYADRKNWPLASVTTRVNHRKIHAEDCQDCGAATGKVDQFERDIEVQGDLDAEQRQKLLEIADRCPVHRTLHAPVSIVSRLRGPD